MRPGIAGVALEVEEGEGDLDRAHPVGDGVVQLLDQRRAPVGHAVDEVHLPQRPGSVEALHPDPLRQVEHLALAARRRRR